MRWMRALSRALASLVAPRGNIGALRDGIALLWRHRALCKEMVKRDLGSQFTGQAIGGYWIIGHPLMLYAIYVLVFTVVLKTRMPESLEMPRDYTTYILSGLAPWLATQQALARSPTALIGQSNLVKQVVFPIEVLPLGAIIAAAIPLLIGIVVILLRSLMTTADIPWTIVLLPVAITIHAAIMLGFAYFLAAVTPFFRDVKDIVAVLTVIGVYLVPAFYLPQWVPLSLQPWIYANPFSYIVWMYQDVLYFGAIRHPYAWVISAAMAVGGLALGWHGRLFVHEWQRQWKQLRSRGRRSFKFSRQISPGGEFFWALVRHARWRQLPPAPGCCRRHGCECALPHRRRLVRAENRPPRLGIFRLGMAQPPRRQR